MNARLYIILASLLFTVATASAQKVKIYGNVYGGGEKAQVIEPNLDSIRNHVIQDADLATLFTKKHTYTTYVRLGSDAEVYGRTFGGGMGHQDSQGESAGRVTGQTDVVLDGATVWSEIFGGGENADVRGNTLLHFKKGKAGHNAFGGGLGLLGGTEDQPDNQREVLASSDVKLIPNKYSLITDDTQANLTELKGLALDVAANWLEKTGESFVVFDGTDDSYTHYEFEKARTFTVVDGKPVVTETTQYDPANPSKLFSINHNIYGGGMTASKIEGKTFVHINHGMVNEDMMNYTVGGEKVWSKVYNSIANAQFCVFGGGYGFHSQVNGDTNVTMDILGSGQYKYINEFTQWFATEGKAKYHWDTNIGEPEAIYKAADESTWSHGAPGRSCMDVIGGGYNGKVLGTTNITIGGDVIVRKVYGGGYYASVGNTKVDIHSGIFNRVYGGGLIGNVYGKATLNVGQAGTTDDIIRHNTHLMVKDAIYGGNDVSGTVGTTAPKDVTAPNGVKYNVYSPYDDGTGGYYGTKQTEYGVRLNMYGGLVLGDVYGAGNGNHPGYTNPAHMQFNLSQHPSENYRKVIEPGQTEITNDHYALVYKYRPRTGRVVMNLQGNAGEKLNDEPLVDKVRIWGRTFGGGNSCNVGIWNGTMDDIAENYSETNWNFANDIATNQAAGASWHPGDNFTGQGTITMNIGSHVQLGNRNDSHETPNGLFMGNNGEHMVTQTTDPKQLKNYHHFFHPVSHKYIPGFLVFDASGTDIGRKAGLKAFSAFINNILTWTDNVELNINNTATDVWMSNFVGGGYRGSMKAKGATKQFAYNLPTGVTIGHSVVGGAFNAHIVYRIYESKGGEYVKDSNDNYIFLTEVPAGWITDKEAQQEGQDYGNYLRQYTDGTILRYNFDGGIMGHESGSIAKPDGSRCKQVINDAYDFSGTTKYDKDKALVYLNLRNKLEPIVIEATETEPAKVHGGIVYGGCFNTGYIDGDVWVDYRCSLSPTCTDKRFFDKTNEDIYGHVDNLDVHNALNVFGAGYGEDTHTMGDTYLRVLHNGTSSQTYDYPFVYNVFGGGNKGTVAGNTNVFYNVGNKGTVLGSLYGGGYLGRIDGNTFVELAGGLLLNAYGGSRQADIGGATHVWAYDGANRSDGEDEASPENAPLLVGNIYGGNDISGAITGGMSAIWTEKTWTDLVGKTFNSYVQVGGTESTRHGYPLIGNIYAGGNGEKTEQGAAAPDVAKTLLEINGGSTVRAFGGGNKATVTNAAYIFVNANSDTYATFTFPDEYQKDVLNKTVFRNIYQGYKWEGLKLTLDQRHASYLYGGNNQTAMAIQPTWNLLQGHLGNVYSGGNLGDMTHPEGINITVSSPTIFIDNLFGGCRMADVKPLPTLSQGEGAQTAFNTYWANTDNYGATVTCTGGYIGNVYGGNDISGTVAHGTKVYIDGAVDNDVYCAGNGNYLYKWDDSVDKVTETKEGDDIIYKVPAMTMFGGAEANDTQKLLTINAWRPSVDRSSLDIAGGEEQIQAQDLQEPRDIKVAFVKGNVYCGGNASTVTGNAATKLTIGSHINVHGLFMGSDGADFSQQEYIAKFEKLNGFDMTAATDFEGLTYGEGEGQVPATSMTEAEKEYYPTLLALYMKAVEMQSQPELTIDEGVTDAYIGTWCGGGNRGSMTSQETVNVTIPDNITIYDKVVAGCMDANVKYVGSKTIEDTGGYYRPLASPNPSQGGEPVNHVKLNYTINAKFLPRYMSVPTGMDAEHRNPEGDDFLTARSKYFLYENVDNNQYKIGNNIYGGCYESGDVLGDVVLNVNSNLLEEPLKKENSTQPNREKLNNTSRNEVAAFNVYGAGMGMDSNVWGNVTINMTGNANNVYGGGRSGTLIGNATINMQNGIVYRHIIGGSDAGYMYGSTQIAVGAPGSYKCNTKGIYTLTRADNSAGRTNHDGSESIVKTINLMPGDIVSEAVYDMLTDKANFEAVAAPSLDWSNTNIYIGGGIYGGGYALATGSTVYAGDTTIKKFTADFSPKNPNTGNKLSDVVGYGGNATIMVADDPNNATTGTTDHITISTLNPVAKSGMSSKLGFFTRSGDGSTKNALGDPVYTWTTQADGAPAGGTTYYELTAHGGIYGDGHLSFVEGFRSADIQRYGYAGSTPQHPKLMNTLQRLDVASVKDCCIMLQGARDFATNVTDATIYSVSRVRELQMKSTLGDDNLDTGTPSTDASDVDRIHDVKRSRNYIGFYNNVHYLGAVKSDVAFGSDRFGEDGVKTTGTSYQTYKSDIITANYPYGDDNTKYEKFRTRNLGTAKNMIGINNGFTLKIQNVKTVAEDGGNAVKDEMFYGPVVGVFEAKLLSLVPGEGGGYIYAANVHDTKTNFLNTSGNFVFPSTAAVAREASSKQYIVDDCFPAKFSGTASAPAHYWYVEGNKYWYNASITGYTADNDNMIFNMDNADQIVTFFGTEKTSKMKLQSITWQHAHSDGYTCDIADTEKNYAFALSVSDEGKYNENGGYLNPMLRSNVNNGDTPVELTYATDKDNCQGNPLLGVQLIDNVKNNGEGYYDAHLKEPCQAKIVLVSENNGQPYTYTINLDVIYLKGPSVKGLVMIDNCALPGELIRATVKDLDIETNDGMPVTRTYWRVADPSDGTKFVKIPRVNTTEIDNSKADFKALYKYNGWKLQYVVEAQGNNFPVDVPERLGGEVYDPDKDSKFETLLVHNYHKMADVLSRQSNESLTLDPQTGARVYINNVADLQAFAQWINDGNDTEGMHFYLQNSLALPADWNITEQFKGTLHGDGYVLDASAVTGTKTLFGGNLTGAVYNLGVAGATIATVPEGSTSGIINCFDNTVDANDLKYGKMAYELSHFHNATSNADYVTDYYTGDDWRYARTTSENNGGHVYLRTGAPAYGTVNTAHNTTHNVEAYTPVEHDYLFFGQALNPTGDAHPAHIADNEANRVFETEGYYNSKVDKKFYYNASAAWAMQPGLTAIRFGNGNTTGEQRTPLSIGSMAVSETDEADYTKHVTRNLLVFEADNATTAEGSKNFFHVKGSKGENAYNNTQNVYTCANLALVDKEDFNAPYAFTATNASYQRTPAYFVETPGAAWESICLPFSPSKTTLSEGITIYPYDNDNEWTKGEPALTKDITFFYGTDETYAAGNHIRHEYWLRELQSVSTTDGHQTATFVRPDANTFAAYTPYIVSFPGSRFYEFNMTGQTITFTKANAVINVTDDATTKAVTKNTYTYTGAFAHEDAAGKYVLNTTEADAIQPSEGKILPGGAFVASDNNNPVLPFRGWMTKPASPAKSRAIYIGSTMDNALENITEEHGDPENGEVVQSMSAYVVNRNIIITSTYDADILIYTSAGQLARAVHVLEGENLYTGFAPGVYIINGKKVVVR